MVPWLVFYLFTTLAPVFSSQCPYKTPMLKGFLCQVRAELHTWPTSLSYKLHALIPTAWPTIKQQCEDLHDLLDTWSATWIAREEAKVRQDGTWDLPTLVCSREILRGEQLEETITDCFQKFDMPTMLRCMKSISDGKGPDVRGVLPDVPQGFAEPVFKLYRSFMGTLISPSDNVFPHSQWYVLSTYALSRSYNPDTNWPIPELSLPLHVRLVNENQTSAVFSVLTMYSVRYNTIESHPEHFDYLFLDKAYDDILYAVGARFASNLVAATRTLCRHLWNQFPVDSEINIENILYWINIAREDSDPDIPTNPIAFIFTFAQILYFLTPQGVRQEHREMIMGMMGELADVVVDVDGSSWSVARWYCAEQAFGHFFDMGLGDGRLIPKLGDVIRTWKPSFDHTRPLYEQD
ncbi:hypothetical protein QCA50_019591 [Cerrena zonata]|uniref:Uncharacterized protein n=1 Tax=Cerrena zonata TaxID=2478898 RepID=A0AAW0FIN8_9APHY